jgi:sugar phosphate permease
MGLSPKSFWNRVFYGWWIVLLGSLVIAVGAGILIHGFTVFFLPLKRDLGVSSAAISLLYGAARLEGGAEGPLVGYLVDRWGPRVLMLIGAILAGAGFLLLSMVQTFWQFFFVYIFIVSLGFNAGFFHPVYAAVNSWFIRHRGKGFAITGAAASIGGMTMAPLLSYLILSFGWRTGAVIAGLIILAVAVPSALPIRRTPESLGLLPDGDSPRADTLAGESRVMEMAPQLEFTVGEALRTFNYWLLFFAIALRVSITVALTIHFVPIFVWKGLTEVASAYLVSLFALSTIPTTLLCGWFGDRGDKSLLCGLGIFPTMAGMLLLMFGQTGIFLYALPIGLAITMGTVPLNWALIGDFFGRRSYGTLRGIMVIGTGLGTFLTPIYAGWIFDRTGGYSLALWTFIFVHLIAAIIFMILHRRSPQNGYPGS